MRISDWSSDVCSSDLDVKGAATRAVPRTRKDGSERPGNPAAAGIGLAKRYVPGSNLWYLRAAYEREILDRLSEQYDPDYTAPRARVEQWTRENGQGVWWAAGASLPRRSPDFTNSRNSPADLNQMPKTRHQHPPPHT